MNNFFYIVSFSLNAPGGKSLGTRSKYNALKKILNTKLLAPKYNNIIFRIFFIFLIEFMLCFICLFVRNRQYIFFTRGVIGILSTKILSKISNHLIIREVHSAPGEYAVIKANPVKKFFIFIHEKISLYIDLSADFRVFNHPNLLNFYNNLGINTNDDIVLYNGGLIKEEYANKTKIKKSFGIKENKIILSFTGSVSAWHNIKNLEKLQKEFDKNCDEIQIVVGGGKILPNIESNILNISPLDEEGCQKLIFLSDACLMPVNEIRVSPGSPLKLYQYLLASKPIITQSNVTGYSDEVLKYKAGLVIDFNNAEDSRLQIINFIENDILKISKFLKENKSNMGITWDDRMNKLKRVIFEHSKIKKY